MANSNLGLLNSLKEKAEKDGVDFHILLCRHNLKLAEQGENWPCSLEEIEDTTSKMHVNLVSKTSDNGDFASQMARALSSDFDFPSSTILMHSMGVMASAMNKAFKIKYYQGEIIANMYVVTAHRPGTGKSNVNSTLTRPIFNTYKEINQKNHIERAKINEEISHLEAIIKKKSKGADDYTETHHAEQELLTLNDKLEEHPIYTAILTDTTIEGAEMVAANQNGMFNIVSAEAESINVILGAVYTKGGKDAPKSNGGLVLSGWDGEYVSIKRAGRVGYEGIAKGSIAVIAQETSVDTIINSPDNRGMAARFLLLNEPDILGKRKFKGRRSRQSNMSQAMRERYESIIYNVINESDVMLDMDDASLDLIDDFRDEVEPYIDEGGIWDNDLITQFVGKADKHILKIAATLHVFNNWHDGGDKNKTISFFSVTLAIQIFRKLINAYIDTLQVMGAAGFKNEAEKVIQKLILDKRHKKVNANQFIDNLKGAKPFLNPVNHRKNVKEKILPYLEERGYCVFANGSIYINPNL